MKACLLAALLLAAPIAWAQTCSEVTATVEPNDKDTVPLCAVVLQVKSALERYQKSVTSGKDALPPLQKAEFTFKTTATTTVGGKIGLFVFALGASHAKDSSNEVVFTYETPKAKPKTGFASTRTTSSLEDQLYVTIRGAAEQVRMANTVGGLPFSTLKVTVQFGVKWAASGSLTASISLITVGLNGERDRGALQTVTLTFDRP